MLPTVVPSVTACTAARVSVVFGTYVKRLSLRSRSSESRNFPLPFLQADDAVVVIRERTPKTLAGNRYARSSIA
jgi:hypothetical protein